MMGYNYTGPCVSYWSELYFKHSLQGDNTCVRQCTGSQGSGVSSVLLANGALLFLFYYNNTDATSYKYAKYSLYNVTMHELLTYSMRAMFKLKNVTLYMSNFDSGPWFLDQMVAHFTLRTHEGKWVFSGKNARFDDSFDVIKCLQQIEKPDLLHMCAQSNEQPSNLKTMLPTI